jgi:hypothetical protein
MKRRLFNLAAAVSVVLCVATVTLWVRGRGRVDSVAYRFFDDDGQSVGSAEFRLGVGKIALTFMLWSEVREALDARYRGFSFDSIIVPPQSLTSTPRNLAERLGFTFFHRAEASATQKSPRRRFSLYVIVVPAWGLVLITAILPIVHTIRFVRDRGHRRSGLCRVCGYDLRESPDRCPECGTPRPSST